MPPLALPPPTTQLKATNLQRSGAWRPEEKTFQQLGTLALETKSEYRKLIDYWGKGISLDAQIKQLFQREDVRTMGDRKKQTHSDAMNEYYRLLKIDPSSMSEEANEMLGKILA